MEAKDIKNIISLRLQQEKVKVPSNFRYGTFADAPNNQGVFEFKDSWYIYETDQKNAKSISGPFSDEDVVLACAKLQCIGKYFKDYTFSPAATETYIHTNYGCISEIGERKAG